MRHDERDPAVPPDGNEVPVETGDAVIVVQGEPLPPAVPSPGTLIRVFRTLAERIPGFTQLSVEQERSMIRAAHLDPEFIADSVRVAEVWEKAKVYAGMTAEEMRELDGEIRHWDDVEKEFLVMVKGIAGANRTRRHRLGTASLDIYFSLAQAVRRPENAWLLPYYERMKRSYMKNRRTRKKAAKAEPAEKPEDDPSKGD